MKKKVSRQRQWFVEIWASGICPHCRTNKHFGMHACSICRKRLNLAQNLRNAKKREKRGKNNIDRRLKANRIPRNRRGGHAAIDVKHSASQ